MKLEWIQHRHKTMYDGHYTYEVGVKIPDEDVFTLLVYYATDRRAWTWAVDHGYARRSFADESFKYYPSAKAARAAAEVWLEKQQG